MVVSRSQVWTNTTGNPGMATAGSGDVLTGVITSMLGQGLSTWEAAGLGVWIHGMPAIWRPKPHGQAGMTALEILAALPQAIADRGRVRRKKHLPYEVLDLRHNRTDHSPALPARCLHVTEILPLSQPGHNELGHEACSRLRLDPRRRDHDWQF